MGCVGRYDMLCCAVLVAWMDFELLPCTRWAVFGLDSGWVDWNVDAVRQGQCHLQNRAMRRGCFTAVQDRLQDQDTGFRLIARHVSTFVIVPISTQDTNTVMRIFLCVHFLLVQLDVVGGEQTRCAVVATEPPILVGEFLSSGQYCKCFWLCGQKLTTPVIVAPSGKLSSLSSAAS